MQFIYTAMSMELLLPTLILTPLLIPFVYLIIFFINKNQNPSYLPKSYPVIGSYFTFASNRYRITQWTTEILQRTPSATFVLHHPFGFRQIYTANPTNVQHILKTNFDNYQKGEVFRTTLFDLLGNGIFNVDGDVWKHQRQIASHEFSTKSLRKFIEDAVDTELNERLIPLLSTAAASGQLLDLQDILQRFGFDNICKIGFGFDPGYLTPSLHDEELAGAFESAAQLIGERFKSALTTRSWKLKRILGIGFEKSLKNAISRMREFAAKMVKEKKQELNEKSNVESVDLLSRFLSAGYDDSFVIDIVISFIIAGRDTTSAALTWFFWLISENPNVETEILDEIKSKPNTPVFEDVRNMSYIHASICESMRLYPPVATDSKVAINDDILPDGTPVKSGMIVTYHPYAMGRMKEIWGTDWEDFKPERWLEKEADGHWRFVGKDQYMYPVFQAGPRICLGKEMAFIQMKRVVSEVLRRFKVVSAIDDGMEPELVTYLSSKMKGGFPVKIEERAYLTH